MEDAGTKAAAPTTSVATSNGNRATSTSLQAESVEAEIELLRDPKMKSFGLQLQSCPGPNGEGSAGCCVKKIMPYVSTQLIEEGDIVVRVNGTDASAWNYERIVQEIRLSETDSLLLSVRRDKMQGGVNSTEPVGVVVSADALEEKKKTKKRNSIASSLATTAMVDNMPDLPPMPPLPTDPSMPPLPRPTTESLNTDPNISIGCQSEDDQLKLSISPSWPKEGKVSGKIVQNDVVVGTIISYLVRFGPTFKENCEKEREDLELVADALFDEGGKPGCRELDGRLVSVEVDTNKKRKRGRPKAADMRCFLYIQELTIESKYRRNGASDIGPAAIRLFLTHESIIKKWDVAAYMTDYRNYMTYDFDDNKSSARQTDGDIMSTERWVPIETEKCKLMSQDARQFIRVGFKELSEETTPKMGILYITGEMLASNQCRISPFTHAEALTIKLRCDSPPDPAHRNLQILDDKLRFVILHECDHHQLATHQRSFQTLFARSQKSQYDDSAFVTSRLIPEIDKYVSEGADITRSNALHASAAAQCIGLFIPLLDRGGDINSRDQNFMTPLMVAASVAGQKDDIIKSQFVVASLIALGANRDSKDRAGRTAVGHFYRTLKSMNNFASKELGLPESPIDATIERLLMPIGGMTSADKRARD